MAKKPLPLLPQQELLGKLREQERRYEQRLDDLIAQVQQERAIASDLRASLQAARARKQALFAEAKALYAYAQKECEWIHGVLAAKQEVIELLLPFYPHAISPELRQRLELQ